MKFDSKRHLNRRFSVTKDLPSSTEISNENFTFVAEDCDEEYMTSNLVSESVSS